MLSYCIPGNRLARTVIREQVEALQGMGIKFKLGIDVGSGGPSRKSGKNMIAYSWLPEPGLKKHSALRKKNS